MPRTAASGIYYERHGSGVPLFLAFPMMASYREIFGDELAGVKEGFLDRLTNRYQVLVADYPNIGRSAESRPEDLTVERACADMLEIVDAAGFDRFAFWGSTFGAIIGLQLAARSARVAALVCGGWPPLGGQFDDMMRIVRASVGDPPASARRVLRSPAQYHQWISFYESLEGFDESGVAERIHCPRMVFAGEDHLLHEAGGVTLQIAQTLRDRRGELEALGWHVALVPGRDSSLILDPAAQVPLVREFLDGMIERGAAHR